MAEESNNASLLCSFCGKTRASVRFLIAGPNVYICNECVDLCVEILAEQGFEFSAVPASTHPVRLEELGLSPVFNRLDIKPRADHCFYLGPFSDPFNEIYSDHIVPTLEREGITVERADMAHTVGKPVIIITQDMGDVPFDLRHRRCIVYQHTPRGCEGLEDQLEGTTRFLLRGQSDDAARQSIEG